MCPCSDAMTACMLAFAGRRIIGVPMPHADNIHRGLGPLTFLARGGGPGLVVRHGDAS